MNTNNFGPIFTEEQLHKMSKENLAKVILLMQKQQSRLEEKVSGLQKKQQLLEEKNKDQEKYLRRYLEDGHLSIDNNDCERSIKNFAVGRCNWLFAKSIKGAEASAVVYSITETAILHGFRSYNYLAYVMEKISQPPQFGDSSYLDDLLPWPPTLLDNLRLNIVKQ